MAWRVSIADVLNQWYDLGVFAYVLPFLLIFAIVYGILDKSRIFSHDDGKGAKEGNRGVNAIIAGAVALLALQFGFVTTFFAEIFPKFGVGIVVLVVLFLMVGLFYRGDKDRGSFYTIGLVLGVATVLWAVSNWDFWGDYFGISWWIQDNFWVIVIGVIVVVALAMVVGKGKSSGKADD